MLLKQTNGHEMTKRHHWNVPTLRFYRMRLCVVVILICLSNDLSLVTSSRLRDKHQQRRAVWVDQHHLQPLRWNNLPVWRPRILCCTAARNNCKIQCEYVGVSKCGRVEFYATYKFCVHTDSKVNIWLLIDRYIRGLSWAHEDTHFAGQLFSNLSAATRHNSNSCSLFS